MPETLTFTRPLRAVRLASAAPEPGEAAITAAYERGRRDGERQLSEQLLRQRNEFVTLQTGLLQSLRGAIPQVVRDSEQTLVALAAAVARKIVGDLPITPELIETGIREALTHVEDSATIRVTVHPDDLALLQQIQSPLLAATPDRPAIQFESAPNLTRGGCLVHTRFGVIDARRETKAELISRALQP
jgi:flagellar assembly protein FliH